MERTFGRNEWALILGGSSGFGLATARKLAAHGMNLCIVHRDRRSAMARIREDFEELRSCGVSLCSFNKDATNAEVRGGILSELAETMGPEGRVRLLMHSIAFGNLRPLVPPKGEKKDGTADGPPLTEDDFAHTIHSMGTSMTGWVQETLARGLFAEDALVIGMTSEGNDVAWEGYAAVSAAKAVLESTARSMALELAPYGIRTNVIQAGITDTPALRLIPGHEKLMASALLRNPFHRLTHPEDVAGVIYLLCREEARWINGTIVRVDGGEHIVGV